MCIKKPYPLLRGVRGGTKAAAPPLSSECEQVDGLSRPETSHASAQGVRGSRNPFRDDLKTCCSETSTVQHIIYNTQTGLFGARSSCEKPLSKTHSGAPLPLPRPPKKKINNPPKIVSPSNLPSPVRAPGIDIKALLSVCVMQFHPYTNIALHRAQAR
jgi:hypothetical protein